MFGTNPLRKQELNDGLRLNIEQIFHTLQGEGPFTGTPAIFIRLAGCWLRCSWCDTEFEKGMQRRTAVEEIEKQVKALAAKPRKPPRLIVLTGGDPLRQNIVPLVSRLADFEYHIQIETAGLMWVPGLERYIDHAEAGAMHAGRASIICSPKTGKVAKEVAQYAAAWKYIIRADDEIDLHDGLPNMSTQVSGEYCKLARPPADTPVERIYLQPCDEYNKKNNDRNHQLVGAIAKKFGYRVSIQQHKLIHLD